MSIEAREFRQRLEATIRRVARDEAGLGSPAFDRVCQKLQRVFACQRLLARMEELFPGQIVVKGGMAMLLRLRTARFTQDVDIAFTGNLADLAKVMEVPADYFGDFMRFELRHKGGMAKHGYGGERYGVTCTIGGRHYLAFSVDVAQMDPPRSVSWTPAVPQLFLDLAPPAIRLYPLQLHIAEKLHAYTEPGSSRYHDLVDVALIGTLEPLDGATLSDAIKNTFSRRRKHAVPSVLPPPADPYLEGLDRLLRDERLPWPTVPDLHEAARKFVDPLLGGVEGLWSPERWAWGSTRAG